MERIQHDLIQGSPEWDKFRLDHDGASECAAMLGLSKNTKRSELLRIKHTGASKEFSDWVRENILDRGHAVEALARPIVEEHIGDDLFPVTYSYGKLSASCDGLTMDGRIAFEHKQWAKELAAAVARGELPEEHQPQCQQVMLVTGASELIFTVSDGTRENLVMVTVYPDKAWQDRIIAGWKQFNDDLAAYQYVEPAAAVTAAATLSLPAPSIQVAGQITLTSNLKAFGVELTAFIDGINKEPKEDQDFANAEAAIKTLERAQEALEAAEAGALSQTASIDEMRRTVALYVELARTTRLSLGKVVTARKEAIRIEIMQGGKTALAEHIEGLNKRLGKSYMPPIANDFAGVIKGKRTVTSLRDAVDTELARAKIEANATADRIQINLNTLRDQAKDHVFLFADTAQIVLKANDDLTALVTARIATHKAEVQKREDEQREQIRKEEEAKATAKLREEQEAQQRAQATPAAAATVTNVIATAAAAPQPVPGATTVVTAAAAIAGNEPEDEAAQAKAILTAFVDRFGKRKEFAGVVKAINDCYAPKKKKAA